MPNITANEDARIFTVDGKPIPSRVAKGRPHTEEAKRKMSLLKKGIPLSEEHKKALSLAQIGRVSPNKGKKLSEEWRKKISLAGMGRKLSDESRKKLSESKKGKHPSEETRQKLKAAKMGKTLPEEHRKKIAKSLIGKHVGSKSGNWKGGITPVVERIRGSGRYSEWRLKCLTRDIFSCQKCGDNNKESLEVHHKKSLSSLLRKARLTSPLLSLYGAAMIYLPLWDVENGITLCKVCHQRITIRKQHG